MVYILSQLLSHQISILSGERTQTDLDRGLGLSLHCLQKLSLACPLSAGHLICISVTWMPASSVLRGLLPRRGAPFLILSLWAPMLILRSFSWLARAGGASPCMPLPLHLPFCSHRPQTPAASSPDNYNSILTNRLLVSPPPIHHCHSNLPKTPFNHAKPLIKNLHYLFITTRIKSKLLSCLPISGFHPHCQLIAHSFPQTFVDTSTRLVIPLTHPERFLQLHRSVFGL